MTRPSKNAAPATRLEWMPIGQLQAASRNPKQHSPEIGTSIGRFGYVEPIVLDERTGRIVAGHGRREALMAMRQRGDAPPAGIRAEGDEWFVPVLRGWASRSDAEAEAYLLASNRLTEAGGWDEQALAEMLKELDGLGALDGVGFDEDEIARLLGDAGIAGGIEGADADEVPEAPAEADVYVRIGDLWLLGKHRLLCGDSTKSDDVARLMDGKRADVCFTSPPYGAGNVAKLRDHYVRGNDPRESFYGEHDDNPREWARLMDGWFAAFRPFCDSVFCNVQMLADNKRDLVSWVAARADDLCDVIVWDKGHGAPQMQRNVLTNVFEFVFVFGGNGSRSIPFGDFHGTIGNMVRVDPHGKNENADVHRATMPVEFVESILSACSLSKSIAEPFCGTGTTIIAAEKTGRLCYAMELEPRYVQVAVERWQKFTGKQATRG